jgi:hypothetical protein
MSGEKTLEQRFGPCLCRRDDMACGKAGAAVAAALGSVAVGVAPEEEK